MKKFFLFFVLTGLIFGCAPQTLTIRFFLQDESEFSASIEVESGSLLNPETPVREGYAFKGWYTQPEGGSPWDFAQPLTQSMNFYAQWEINSHYVVFHSNSGESPEKTLRQTFPEGGDGLLIPNPFIRDGYKFLGWSLSASSSDIAYSDRALLVMGKSDIDLYAVWGVLGPNEFRIIFHSNVPGNDETAVQIVYEDTAIVLDPNPFVRSGYRFLGWAESSDAVNPVYADRSEWTAGNSDTDLYAVWEELITVTFDPDNGSAPVSVEMTKGAVISRPDTDPEKEGVCFYDWMNGDSRWDFSLPVQTSLTLRAKWVAYAIRYSAVSQIDLSSDWNSYNSSQSFFDTGRNEGLWVFDSAPTGVPEKAFSGNTVLTAIDLPETVTGLGSYAFYNCTALVEVTVRGKLTAIPPYAFYNCKKLQTVNIPDSVTTFGNSAFSLCLQLASVSLPEGVVSLGKETFLGCTSLEQIVIPSSLQTVDMSEFFACTSLKEVVLQEGLLSLKDTAFAYCSSLEEIHLPSSVTEIGGAVFTETSALKTVTIDASQPPKGITGLTFSNVLEQIRVPADSVSAYKADSGWSLYADKIQAAP